MINALRPFVLAVWFAALLVPAAHAATYIVPPDAQLVQTADDIVVATAVSSASGRDARGAIVTRTTLVIEEAIKGDRARGQQLVLTERGGVIDGQARIISGVPVYQPGARYLVFTSANRDFEPITSGMSLGQFRLIDALAVRDTIHGFDANLEPHAERARHAQRFLRYVREVAAQRYAPVDYFVADAERRQIQAEAKIAANALTRGSYLLQTNTGVPFRWLLPSANWVRSGAQPGVDGPGAVSVAFGQWNATASSIDYADTGVDDTALGGLESEDGKNAVLFNDPNNEIPAGVAGIGGAFGNVFVEIDGENSVQIFEGDLVIAKIGFSQACLNAVMTHEVGHTLGFRHSNEPPAGTTCGVSADCTGDAIMNATVTCSLASNLRTWDHTAAETVYGNGPACNAPSILTPPASKNIAPGSSTQLTVVAGGTAPLTYAWFIGETGDTSTPTGANAATITVSPSVTTKYWVRVTNTCGGPAADSAAATVAVVCTEPSITTPPASVSITEGQSTQLRVFAAGAGLTYQWYIGNSGDTSQPIGASANAITVTPTQTTNFWVRVSGACGSPVDSATVTVTVVPCAELDVQEPTATALSTPGAYTLSVNAFSSSTPLLFAWYRGNTPGSGGTPVGTSQSINVTVSAVTSYWARVTNGCGKTAVTSLITVAPCQLPQITAQPSDETINSGQQVTLEVAYSGTATVLWYEGTAPDETELVGSGATLTVAPTQTTKYWAKIVSTCGPVSTRTATVTVNQAVTSLPMLGSRFVVEVRYRNQFANPPTTGLLLGRSLSSSNLSDTAIFWFNDPTVVELMVRLSDARPFDDHIHVFFGGLSDVEFFITVTDTATGTSKEYNKKPNELVGFIDRATFVASTAGTNPFLTELRVLPAASNVEDSDTVMMLNGRYRVRMRYRNQFASPPTTGYLLGRSIASSTMTETVVFFNDPQSVEWMVRFSDARPFDEHIHFFHGGLSDLELTIEVTDTETGQTKEYHKLPNTLAGTVDRVTWEP